VKSAGRGRPALSLNRPGIALAIPCLHAVSIPTAVSASVMALPSRERNLAHLKSSPTSNLNELVEQKVLISRILHILDDRLDAPPLFVTTQSTLAQDDQPWMHIHIEEFDEVSRICRNNCKIVIKRILPYLMIRRPAQPTCGTDCAYMPTSANLATNAGQICSSRSRRMTTWSGASCEWPDAFWGVPAFHQSEKIGERMRGLAH
jgi:hypothetical protein